MGDGGVSLFHRFEAFSFDLGEQGMGERGEDH